MLMVEGTGIPVSLFVTTAQIAEVKTIETLVDVRQPCRTIRRLIYDKAADADWLRDELEERGIELICPHRKGRKRKSRQDGRSLRRYRHRGLSSEPSVGSSTTEDSSQDTNTTHIYSKDLLNSQHYSSV